eukprot:CAMPEP_0201578086 /NCGR_PEP_ID=MMETSP0190_2-20130828/24795_1 /ASSEMBLY_ACC=CAM_ASM_000263 /TAXON_ID=37353 /ORGANISM="Rosalina sp." /LENGTH=202 /DNA_ID=CAMNT_0048010877 /DNA_START=68 /DNA_END=677 /DNA_ORIENTATION=+
MFIRKENKKIICEHLFNQGVIWAKKNLFLPRHPEVGVPNIEVIKLMKSFRSKEYVVENFNWQTYYWRLTNDGHEYLQKFLNTPSDVVPNTWKPSHQEQAKEQEWEWVDMVDLVEEEEDVEDMVVDIEEEEEDMEIEVDLVVEEDVVEVEDLEEDIENHVEVMVVEDMVEEEVEVVDTEEEEVDNSHLVEVVDEEEVTIKIEL